MNRTENTMLLMMLIILVMIECVALYYTGVPIQ